MLRQPSCFAAQLDGAESQGLQMLADVLENKELKMWGCTMKGKNKNDMARFEQPVEKNQKR